MYKNIIFDLGGVLIDWNPRYLYRKIFDSEEKIDWFLENICDMDWNEQQDAGRPLTEATKILVDKYPEYETEISAYYGRWIEMLDGPIQGTVDILKQTIYNPNFRVVALTNWSAETFPFALERYDFLGWFEGVVMSGEEKCKKPDPKIYNTLLDRFDMKPEDCIFIDDSLRNIKGGEELGINGIHFTNPEDLSSKLSEKGIALS